MCNTQIDEHCAIIEKYGSKISIEQLKTSFDIFILELKQIDIFDIQCRLIQQIISSLACVPYRNKKLADSKLITHELYIFLRDNILINHFHQRNTEDETTQQLLLNVSTLFVHLCSNINDNNITEFKHLFFHKLLIDELTCCLKEIAIYGKYLNNIPLLRSTSFLLVAFKYFHGKQLKKQEYSLITPIFFAVIQCLCSSYAIDMIQSLEQNFTQKLHDNQTLFLSTMPWYLQWYSDYRDSKNLIKILRRLLNEFTIWITNCHPDFYLQCSTKFGTMIRHLSYFLVRPIESDNVNIFSEEFYHDYCKLVSYWSSILSSTLEHSTEKIKVKYSTRIIVQNLYNFTLHQNVLNFMKTIPNLISILLKMTMVENDEIQLNVYRCLGKIMIESDIKTLANPCQIVAVHIEFITNTIDNPNRTERFYSLLESLKNFVQHDQVKSELMKQQALPLLIKCVVETRFDPIKVQQIALEILLALSFDNNACLLLRQDHHFIHHIGILANNINSNKLGLQRAAEGLLWRLEKDDETATKPTILNSYKYDIMISYSHKDQQLCRQIHKQLVNDGFRVWFDRDCLRGSTMIGMANAIENSVYVLICMSNAYKQSVYCQSEAHYAYERGCCLIPIIVEANYKPDGWLGIIVSGKIYVDFVTVNFQTAYEKLKNEINQQRCEILNQSSTKSEEIHQIDEMFIESKHIEFVSDSVVNLPDCITQWTHDHVRTFLLQLRLGNTILPLCTRTDGYRLLQLYEMCLRNREGMYQSLKFELNERHQRLLLVDDYITFLHEIKLYVPSNSSIVETTQSSFLSFTFCNVM